MRDRLQGMVNRHELKLATGIATVLFLRQTVGLILPYVWPGKSTTLREDVYWAYSGGFGRRGLLGEILYSTSELLSINTSMAMSGAFVAAYAWTTFLVLRRVLKSADVRLILLLCCTPLVFNFAVDREILMLAPLTLIAAAEGDMTKARTGLLLIPFSVLVHELALILYIPLLAQLHWVRHRRLCLSTEMAAAALSSLAVTTILAIGASPDWYLERQFWPARGVEGLESSFLYRFVGMSLRDLLSVHADLLLTPNGLVGVAFGALLTAYLLYGLRRSRLSIVLAAISILPFLVLTIDYGRYSYFLFYFFVLSDASIRAAARLSGGSPRASESDPVWLSGGAGAFLVGLAVWPVGFFASTPDWPTVGRMIEEVARLVPR